MFTFIRVVTYKPENQTRYCVDVHMDETTSAGEIAKLLDSTNNRFRCNGVHVPYTLRNTKNDTVLSFFMGTDNHIGLEYCIEAADELAKDTGIKRAISQRERKSGV